MRYCSFWSEGPKPPKLENFGLKICNWKIPEHPVLIVSARFKHIWVHITILNRKLIWLLNTTFRILFLREEDTFTICSPFYKTKFILLGEVLYSSSSQLCFDLKTAILAELPFLHRFFKFIVSVKKRVEKCIFYWLKQENFKCISSKNAWPLSAEALITHSLGADIPKEKKQSSPMFCGNSFGALWSFSFRSIPAKLSFTSLDKFDFDHIKFGCCCSNQTFIILKTIFEGFPIQFHNDVVWLKSKGSNFFNVIITFFIIF